MTKDLPTSANWGMIGHEWAVDLLKEQILHQAVRHAYLFTGTPGVGRQTLALRLTQALTCLNPPAPATPCLACRTCNQIEARQYSDLAVVQSESEGGVIKAEQIRSLRQALVLKPYQGKYRLALFVQFEDANDHAANALLKTLEEAPAHALLLITANSTGSLLPTIVSRCEILRLRPVPLEKVESALLERNASAEQATLLAHLSAGRPGIAFHLLADDSLLDLRLERLDDLHRLLRASRVEKFAYAEKLAKDKDLFRRVLFVWLDYWRDVLVQAAGSAAPLVNVDRSAEIKALAHNLHLPEARRLVLVFETAIERLDKNVNARLLAEVLLLDLLHV